MKTFYLTLLMGIFTLISGSISGQEIPNSGFENWTSADGILEPDGWTTNNSQAQDEPGVPPLSQGNMRYVYSLL